MHWAPRALAELQATAARNRGSFEFALELVPADVPNDRPPDGAPPEDCDRFASRQLQLWLNRLRGLAADAKSARFHLLVERSKPGEGRAVFALVHEAGRAPICGSAALRAWPGRGSFRSVGPDDAATLLTLRDGNACNVFITRASLHYGEPDRAAARLEDRPRARRKPKAPFGGLRRPNKVLFGPQGPAGRSRSGAGE